MDLLLKEKNMECLKQQECFLVRLINILQQISAIINSSYNSSCVNDIKQELIQMIQGYNTITKIECNGVKLFSSGLDSIYGTINSNKSKILEYSKPLTFKNGLGGITNVDIPKCKITVCDTDFNIEEGDDIAYLSENIRNYRFNKQFVVVSGLEWSLKLLKSEPGNLNITVKSVSVGNESKQITIMGNTPYHYDLFIQELLLQFGEYIQHAWFDTSKMIARVIMKDGYTVILSTAQDYEDGCIVRTYVNDIKINSLIVNRSPIYLIGYLLFYSVNETFQVIYPPELAPCGDNNVQLTQICAFDNYYNSNLSLNLRGLMGNDITQYSHIETNLKKVYITYGKLLKNILNSIEFNNNIYNVWRRTNVLFTINSLIASFISNVTIFSDLNKKYCNKTPICDSDYSQNNPSQFPADFDCCQKQTTTSTNSNTSHSPSPSSPSHHCQEDRHEILNYEIKLNKHKKVVNSELKEIRRLIAEQSIKNNEQIAQSVQQVQKICKRHLKHIREVESRCEEEKEEKHSTGFFENIFNTLFSISGV